MAEKKTRYHEALDRAYAAIQPERIVTIKLTENIADARAFNVEDAVALCWGLERMTEERWRWRFRTHPMDVHMSVVYRVELREGGNSPPEYIAEEENGNDELEK